MDALVATTNPIPVVDDVITKASGSANFGVSGDGTLVYVSGAASAGGLTLVWVDRNGEEEPLGMEHGRLQGGGGITRWNSRSS